MADYYASLARAVVKVDPADHQEFYQCTRDTLVNVLRRRNPKISAATISREQAALQRAIVRLDAELRLTALNKQITPYLEDAADAIATSPQRRGADSSILRRLKPMAPDGRLPHQPAKPKDAQSVWFSKIPGLLERPPISQPHECSRPPNTDQGTRAAGRPGRSYRWRPWQLASPCSVRLSFTLPLVVERILEAFERIIEGCVQGGSLKGAFRLT
jgi:hypothetical protein